MYDFEKMKLFWPEVRGHQLGRRFNPSLDELLQFGPLQDLALGVVFHQVIEPWRSVIVAGLPIQSLLVAIYEATPGNLPTPVEPLPGQPAPGRPVLEGQDQ